MTDRPLRDGADPRADTIRRELESYAATAHRQELPRITEAIAALDGLLADAAEEREEAERWRAQVDTYRQLGVDSLTQCAYERDVALARVAALETALREIDCLTDGDCATVDGMEPCVVCAALAASAPATQQEKT